MARVRVRGMARVRATNVAWKERNWVNILTLETTSLRTSNQGWAQVRGRVKVRVKVRVGKSVPNS